MTDCALSCRGLSKEYRIGQRESYKALRDLLTDTMYAPFRRIKAALRGQTPAATQRQTFWALDDVSFDVRAGDVVGVIGGNGAGKSTLLKILSRITEPTSGHAHVRGRVGSLLEVGTGFNPELTGRENTYLNGAILGMKKVDIDRRFDEIVAFAEVERFLDTPVKHYSSGMYMRLAFAVAAHLEPEILLVDEVLAVGDAQFQKKCFAKMQEIGRGGRTILLVSHNMSAVRHICTRGIALEAGRLVDDGDINAVVDRYIASASTNQPQGAGMDTATFKVHETSIRSRSGPVIKTFDSVEIRVAFTPKFDVSPGFSVAILTSDNVRLIALQSKDFHPPQLLRAGTRTEIGLVIDGLPLLNGTYQMEVHIHDDVSFVNEAVPRSTYFDVVETPVYGGRKIDRWFGSIGVRVRPAADPVLDGDKNRPRILAAEREMRSGPLVKEAKC